MHVVGMIRKTPILNGISSREYYRQCAFSKMMGGMGAFGKRNVLSGDEYEQRRRLREWIEGKSEGKKRIDELRLEKERNKRKIKRLKRTLLSKQRERKTDSDELFYEVTHDSEEEELKECDDDHPNPSPMRCVFVASDALYELCSHEASVWVNKYVDKVNKYAEDVQFLNVIEFIFDHEKNHIKEAVTC
eukprot:932895_1